MSALLFNIKEILFTKGMRLFIELKRFVTLLRAYCFLRIVSFLNAKNKSSEETVGNSSFYVKPDETGTWDKPF